MLRNIDLDEISDGKLYTAGDLARSAVRTARGAAIAAVRWGIRLF